MLITEIQRRKFKKTFRKIGIFKENYCLNEIVTKVNHNVNNKTQKKKKNF